MNEHCAENLSALLRHIENGEDVPADLRSHLATCQECARLLDAMKRMQSDVDREDAGGVEATVVARTVEKSAEAVSRSRRMRVAAQAIAVAITVAAAIWMISFGVSSPREGLAIIGITFLIIAPLFVVIAGIYLLRQRLHEPGKAMYKRLKPGRQLDGVCLGLAEATGTSVFLLRLIFFALLFADGVGFWLYLLLMVLMPVHPEDRQYLLRFQIARAFRRMTGRGGTRVSRGAAA